MRVGERERECFKLNLIVAGLAEVEIKRFEIFMRPYMEILLKKIAHSFQPLKMLFENRKKVRMT